jgi:hypothetical protein
VAADVRHRLGLVLDEYEDDDAPEVREATADVGEALYGQRERPGSTDGLVGDPGTR